jgi:hypothetical protein
LAKSLPPSATRFLHDAWRFFRKHPALLAILFWLLILPDAVVNMIERLGLGPSAILLAPHRGVRLEELFGSFVVVAALLLTLWGQSCVLFVGKRMVQNKVGRARSSFKSVRRDALPFVAPFLFTMILRASFFFYRCLFFLVPFILFIHLNVPSPFYAILFPLALPAGFYVIRTAFADVALFCEGTACRAALARSQELTRGRLVPVFLMLLSIAAFTLLPAFFASWAVDMLLSAAAPRLGFVSDILGSALRDFAFILFAYASVAYYGELRKTVAVPIELFKRKTTLVEN